MGVYRVDKQELIKALGTLKYIHKKMGWCYEELNAIYRLIEKQKGLGIQGVQNTIYTRKENLRLQRMNVAELQDCVQSIIDKTEEASGNAQKILESVDLSKAMKDAAVVGAGAVVGGKSNGTVNNPSGGGGASTLNPDGSVWATNANTYYAPPTKYDFEGSGNGCGVFSHAMVLTNLGLNVKPYDLYLANKSNVGVTDETINNYGYRMVRDKVHGLSTNEKLEHLRRALLEHPEGVILRWDSGYNTPHGPIEHFVVAKGINADGSVIINDPWWDNRENFVMWPENLSTLDQIRTLSRL